MKTTTSDVVDVKTPLVSLIVPFYNERAAVERFFTETVRVLESVRSIRFEIVCINDGSVDGTLEQLVAASRRDARVRVIDLTRNFGKEAALTAGLDEALGDAVIAIDADLQDPPSLIPEMIERWRDGAEVVLARRASRACDSFLKRTTAALFYRVHNALSEVKIPENVGDFRLIDRRVVNALRQLPERHRFMKGLFAWVGFRTVTIDYEREPRSAGHSKFSGWRLWNFALEGITSFSTVPLRSWTYIGCALALLAFLYGGFIVSRTLLFGNPVPGYASLISIVLFLGGIQLIGIGVIGEYVGRIYDESKGRPIYLVRRRYEVRTKVSTLPVGRAGSRPAGAESLRRARSSPRLRVASR
ncbi:glycosyltransferase family 2 protein [Paraburkholderia pallida]|uniref:Glycosyltransferase n=1 Tax=Paraburkholderia pallida TaxID=2547399 RepID=A0A4P7CVR7_9BURK|nr:glycosyltransferase family 2 protein [Paraburkholderia pallida]QBQ98319.1 glycosyltransferase [Paraburkholderia pallida]